MVRKEFTIIHAVSAVLALGRAGQHSGITNVGRLCGVTKERARGTLGSAVSFGMVYTYDHQYRTNVGRCCYGITDVGRIVLDTIKAYEDSDMKRLFDVKE